jgi:hypothetical protein
LIIKHCTYSKKLENSLGESLYLLIMPLPVTSFMPPEPIYGVHHPPYTGDVSTAVKVINEIHDAYMPVMWRELEEEVKHVKGVALSPHRYYFNGRMRWYSYTGYYLLADRFPRLLMGVEGLADALTALYQWSEGETYSLRMDLTKSIAKLWEDLWYDQLIEIHPAAYTHFIRNKIIPWDDALPFPLYVREFAIEVEKARQRKKLDSGLLTPRIIDAQVLRNGIAFALLDCARDIEVDNPRVLTPHERACFVIVQLILGSRFKGISESNTSTMSDNPPWVYVGGLSKTTDRDKVAHRPLNVLLLPVTDKFSMFLQLLSICRIASKRIHSSYKKDGKERVYVDGVMRKQLRQYIKQVFPGMLHKGESTHLLRKIYLQLAYSEYGGYMKETGFAATVFAHEGYGTSLHYTTVFIKGLKELP